jgi:acetolactate synthase small subunit
MRHSTACYSVTAVPDPSVMSRVLELFTKRNLIPDRFGGSLVPGEAPRLEMSIEIAGLDHHLAGYLGRCMEQITYVLSVEVSGQLDQQAAKAA